MICALCLQPRALRRSHIIPEFMYNALYDDKHRFWCVSAEVDSRNELKQKGEREELLCDQCEGRFARHERYASLVHNGGIPLDAKREGSLIILDGINYTTYKLFQLSVLWRASVSRLPLFERVDLGPHEEILRRQLLNDDAGKPTRYGCVMFGLTMTPGETPALIMQPTRVRSSGINTYKFVFGGIVWNFFVDKQELGYPFNHIMLSESGKLVLQIRAVHEMEDLRKFLKIAGSRGKLP